MSDIEVQIMGHTGPGRYGDNIDVRLRQGLAGDLIVSELNGKYYEQVTRGNVFIYSTATAGVTLNGIGPNLPTIWNPSGSGRYFIPIKVLLGYVSGASAASHLIWCVLNNAGSQIGTAAPVTSLTAITPVSALIGSQYSSMMRFASTISFGVVPTYLRPIGISTATANSTPYFMGFEEDGTICIPPGNALTLAASITTGLVANVTIVGLELQQPLVF